MESREADSTAFASFIALSASLTPASYSALVSMAR